VRYLLSDGFPYSTTYFSDPIAIFTISCDNLNKFMTKSINFSKDFTWGAATAAYQIEGHPEEAKDKLSDWSIWRQESGKVLAPDGAGLAVKHYEKLEEDLDLLAELKVDSYRFSFNWATLHRATGAFDKETTAFYRRLLDGLKARNIKPMATICHFTLPAWLYKDGAWTNFNTALEFENYTNYLLEHFGDDISLWLTLNEPNIYLGFGYESGIWPPGYENAWNKYFEAYQGMLSGHVLAYCAIKEYNPEHQVGFANNMYAFEAKEISVGELANEGDNSSNSAASRFANGNHAGSMQSPDSKASNINNNSIGEMNAEMKARRVAALNKVPVSLRKQIHNYSFIESALETGTLDFLGINYYTRFRYEHQFGVNDPANPDLISNLWGKLDEFEAQRNSLGWETYAKGLKDILVDPKLKFLLGNRPIYITENGYSHIEDEPADNLNDQNRVDYINQHLSAVSEAICEGANVQGYYYWSFIDNFEWALGMAPRFGLVHVDQKTFKRTPKASFRHYAKLHESSGMVQA
jgi:beta-glucosidase